METIENLPSISKLSNYEMEARQANWLIESSSSMTVNEKRVLYYILGEVNPLSIEQVKDFEIDIKKLANLFEIKNNGGSFYKTIREAIEKLWARDIITREKSGLITKYRLLQKQQYNDRQGFISVRITDDFQSAIYALQNNYTTIVISNLIRLTSPYSFKLYELLWQYRNYGENKLSLRKTRLLSLNQLRFYFNCENTYQDWHSFNKRTILPAVEELNKKTNLIVETELIKEGKSVTGVRFLFGEKENFKNGKLEYKRTSPPARPTLKRASAFEIPNELSKENKELVAKYWKEKNIEEIWDLKLSERERGALSESFEKFSLNQLRATIINLKLLQTWKIKLEEWGGCLPMDDKRKIKIYHEKIVEIHDRYPSKYYEVVKKTEEDLNAGVYGKVKKSIDTELLIKKLNEEEEAFFKENNIPLEFFEQNRPKRGRPKKIKNEVQRYDTTTADPDDLPF